MKYPPGEFMAEAVGRVWGRSAAFQKKSWDLIVPIPLHWKKRIRRGYNQSYALARGLSMVLKIPVEHRWLTRFINNPSQATLMRHERIKNAVGIFKASGRRELGRVLLIDDVVTTGSTVNEAAHVLKQSGAAQVTVATVAHG
jgi:ComF family protein